MRQDSLSNAPGAGATADAPNGTPKLTGDEMIKDALVWAAHVEKVSVNFDYAMATAEEAAMIRGLVARIRELEAEREWKPASSAVVEINGERWRQQMREGFGDEHDNKHAFGELAIAAALYASPKPLFEKLDQDMDGDVVFVDPWPWDASWDKRKKHPRRKALVIAAALLVAEIERLDRSVAEGSRAAALHPSSPPVPPPTKEGK